MKKHVLCYLIVVTIALMLATVVSFASNDADKKPINNDKSNAVTKQLLDKQLSGDKMDQLTEYLENKAIQSNSYDDPVTDEEDYIELYYPEPGDSYYLGDEMDIEFDVYDTWEDYYTIPVIGIFDSNGDLIDVIETDIADVDDWTEYEGSIYLDPTMYSPGTHELYIFNVPCYDDGSYVDGWDEWDDVPFVDVDFKIVCKHSWKHYKTAAGLLQNGSEYDQCTICKMKKNVRTLPGYANYYVKSFKVSKGKKAFTAKWKKQSKKNQKLFNGYQIMYSTNADMSDAKYATASKSSKSKKIKKLTKKTVYYVQVRTFTKKDGTTFYSKWSAKKSVKTK